MNATEMIGLMNMKPFLPLQIHMADGTQIQVEEPFQIATARNSPICIVYEGEGKTHYVAYRNISYVTTKSVENKSPSNP